MADVKACRPCLEAEIQVVNAAAIVLLGATAASAILGPRFPLDGASGEFLETDLDALVPQPFIPQRSSVPVTTPPVMRGWPDFVRDPISCAI